MSSQKVPGGGRKIWLVSSLVAAVAVGFAVFKKGNKKNKQAYSQANNSSANVDVKKDVPISENIASSTEKQTEDVLASPANSSETLEYNGQKPHGPRSPSDPSVALMSTESLSTSPANSPPSPKLSRNKELPLPVEKQKEEEVQFTTKESDDSVIVDVSNTPLSDALESEIQEALQHTEFAKDVLSPTDQIVEPVLAVVEPEEDKIVEDIIKKESIPDVVVEQDNTNEVATVQEPIATEVEVEIVQESTTEVEVPVAENIKESEEIVDTTEEPVSEEKDSKSAISLVTKEELEFNWSDSVPEDMTKPREVSTPIEEQVVVEEVKPKFVEAPIPTKNVWAIRTQQKQASTVSVTEDVKTSESVETNEVEATEAAPTNVGVSVIIPAGAQANVKPGISYAGAAGGSSAVTKSSSPVNTIENVMKEEVANKTSAKAAAAAAASNSKKKNKKKANKKKTASVKGDAQGKNNKSSSLEELKFETIANVPEFVPSEIQTFALSAEAVSSGNNELNVFANEFVPGVQYSMNSDLMEGKNKEQLFFDSLENEDNTQFNSKLALYANFNQTKPFIIDSAIEENGMQNKSRVSSGLGDRGLTNDKIKRQSKNVDTKSINNSPKKGSVDSPEKRSNNKKSKSKTSEQSQKSGNKKNSNKSNNNSKTRSGGPSSLTLGDYLIEGIKDSNKNVQKVN